MHRNPKAKISVVTITMNRREMLREAIESVLSQGYENFEHIVIDGGSTDGTVELLRSYKHLKWVSEPDDGQAQAMNKGLEFCTGDIFAWLNSDDTYPIGVFDDVNAEFYKNPDASFVYGTCNLVDRDNQLIGKTNYHSFSYFKLIAGFNDVNTPAVFVSLDHLRKAGRFNEELKATYDVDMWIRLVNFGRAVPVKKVYSNLRLHDGSGLIGPKYHLAELPLLKRKYFQQPTLLQRFMLYPYYKLRNSIFNIKMLVLELKVKQRVGDG